MDVIIYENYSRVNSGFSNILLAVDCFSKRVFVEKMKGRTAQDVKNALAQIFKRSKRKPTKIFADKDTAFTSTVVKGFLKKNGIELYHAVSYLHSSLAERYVGRFKRIMARIFTHNNNHRWLGYEQDVADNINHSYNRSIGMASADVNKKNESLVWHRLYSKYIRIKNPIKPKFKVGDLVKISTRTLKDVFRKSYDVSWSTETYKVKEIKGRDLVPYFKLEDLDGEEIEGSYYNEELQLVGRPENSDD